MAEPWHPHAGQKKAVKFLLEHAAAGLFADPGVGKTSAVYAAFSFLKKRKIANRMLVIAPLRPCQMVWPAEREKWSDFAHLSVEVLHGPGKDAALARNSDVCVINPEGLDWLLDVKRTKSAAGRLSVATDLKSFKALGFDTLVLDELTIWKNTGSGRHKALKQVVSTFARRWGLTGTPVPNGLIDLFGQCYMLDMGRSFGQFITHFRREYFLPSYDGFSWTLQKGAEDRIYERIKPLALRLAAEDYVDMPEMVENVLRFDLPPAVRKVYDELEDDMITSLGDAVITAATAAALSTKLRQVVSGGLYVEDAAGTSLAATATTRSKGREWFDLHDLKTEMVYDLVEELQGTPLLVAYQFKHDLARLQKKFGSDLPVIGGGTSFKRAVALEKAWNRGELPILAGHPQSIGHGLNLQNAGNHVCWYSLPNWNLELYDQFNRRVRRQGSKHSRVFVHHLIARNTVDEVQMYSLRHKSKGQTALFDALKVMRKGRMK
jgi:SNF2 family DNA or RNA helicase